MLIVVIVATLLSQLNTFLIICKVKNAKTNLKDFSKEPLCVVDKNDTHTISIAPRLRENK